MSRPLMEIDKLHTGKCKLFTVIPDINGDAFFDNDHLLDDQILAATVNICKEQIRTIADIRTSIVPQEVQVPKLRFASSVSSSSSSGYRDLVSLDFRRANLHRTSLAQQHFLWFGNRAAWQRKLLLLPRLLPQLRLPWLPRLLPRN